MGYKKKPDLFEGCAIIVTVLLIILILNIDYAVWRLQHPEAPAWTYILK